MKQTLARWLIAVLMVLAHQAGAADNATISASDAHELAKTGKAILIDIRTPEEWRETGVPAGAKRANMANPAGAAGFLQDILAIVGNDRNQPVALICRTGNRTARAQAFLASQGFTQVLNVSEGVAGSSAGSGWLKRGLPVEPCRC